MASPNFHIAMYPWFAMGHLIPFPHLSNKLAKKGHRISFFIPAKTIPKLESFNLHPHLISFVPITVPQIDGLPPGAETTSDVQFSLYPLIMTAMDRTEGDIEQLLCNLKPNVVFFDFTCWLPNLTTRLGSKSICYCVFSSATVGYSLSQERRGKDLTETDLMEPPPGFPEPLFKLHVHEARRFAAARQMKFGCNVKFGDRISISLSKCDEIGFRACREIEGPYIDYFASQIGKTVLLSGPAIPEPPTTNLDEKWDKWLGRYEPGSAIYCALGSECVLRKDQFHELLLGLELTGMPFLAVLKLPLEAKSVEEAWPEGFKERVEGRGIVHGEWVQQLVILQHPSVGCFLTHCGSGSLSEALVNKCQLVLLPQISDHVMSAKLMSQKLKVGVEVNRGEEDGLFTKESICKAVKAVVEDDSEIGREIRFNRAKLRECLLKKDLESSYIDSFNQQLQDL